MCGICGFAVPSSSDRRVDESVVTRMCESLVHRGPDDSGIYADTHAALAHRRLSIVDLSGGHQPMSNEDKRIWITYNGEVYNHLDLKPDLEKAGHIYRTSCDTETIIHLYEDQGKRAADHLRGMFAFAIWDSRRRQLLLARD